VPAGAAAAPGALPGDVAVGLAPGFPESEVAEAFLFVFVAGDAIRDKRDLRQAIGDRSEIYVMQALSGG
jgi:hypothetical protein